MRISYDSEADAMMIYFKEGKVPVAHSREIVPPRMIVRFDEHENPIRIELLYVSDYVSDPAHVDLVDLMSRATQTAAE